jgi:hypothetical protein
VRALGLLAALNGVDHGIGAITQGAGRESWAHVDAFDPLAVGVGIDSDDLIAAPTAFAATSLAVWSARAQD